MTAASQRDPGAVMRCITDAVGHFDETLVGTYVMLVVERRATARPASEALPPTVTSASATCPNGWPSATTRRRSAAGVQLPRHLPAPAGYRQDYLLPGRADAPQYRPISDGAGTKR